VSSLRAVPSETATLEWREPEPKLWVALRDGDSIGTVEFHDGCFVTFNRGGAEITTSSSLPAAKAVLSDHRGRAVPLSYVAVVTGIVAISIAAMALFSVLG